MLIYQPLAVDIRKITYGQINTFFGQNVHFVTYLTAYSGEFYYPGLSARKEEP